jgi:hypothetical protein
LALQMGLRMLSGRNWFAGNSWLVFAGDAILISIEIGIELVACQR